jgi:acyl carrier protein
MTTTTTEIITTTTQQAQWQQLHELVAEVLELRVDEFTDTNDFVDDLGADSLQAIEILARVERDLGVNIPQEDLVEMTNLAAVRTIVARRAGWDPCNG